MPDPVRIEKMIYGGLGIAGEGTREVAAPFVLPGELIKLNHHGEINILEPSPDRIAPTCIHFGSCGGCHYQHASYPAQIAIKTAVLRDTLTAAGITEVPEILPIFAEPFGYRNRIRLRVGEVVSNEGSEVCVGYNRRDASGGDALLPITMCPIAAPLLWRAAETLVSLTKTDPLVALWMKASVELELFTSSDEKKLQMTLFIRKPVKADFNTFCSVVRKHLPELSGAGIAILPTKPSQRGRRSERAKPGAQWGSAGMMYSVNAEDYWVSRGSFFQVNRFLVSELAALVVAGRNGNLAWDLYAGVGLFTRGLMKNFSQVIAVEAAESAAADLVGALKRTPHRAVAMTTLNFLQAAVVQRERPDVIVMDPPRAGVGDDVCALLLRVNAPELVYVSCDPVTLARDLAQLIDGGYKLQSLNMVDMFPQTYHQETVAVLVR